MILSTTEVNSIMKAVKQEACRKDDGLGGCWIGAVKVVQENPDLKARLQIPIPVLDGRSNFGQQLFTLPSPGTCTCSDRTP